MPSVAGTGSTDISSGLNPAYNKGVFCRCYSFLFHINLIFIN